MNFQYLPLSVTLAYIENPEDPEQPIFVLDPTQEEADALDGCITYAMDAHGTIVAIEKAGGVPLPPGQVKIRLCQWPTTLLLRYHERFGYVMPRFRKNLDS